MTKSCWVVCVALASAACNPIQETFPTAPTPVAAPMVAQLMIRVAGPDTWWPDRLLVHVTAFDAHGGTARGIVECDSTRGYSNREYGPSKAEDLKCEESRQARSSPAAMGGSRLIIR